MVKFHLKTLNAPKTWKIKRKETVFITKPNPGPHNSSHSMPLATVIRDFLEFSKTAKETKYILNTKTVLVNSKRRKDGRMPVGIIDVLEFPDVKKCFRVLINGKGKLCFVQIPDAEKTTRVLKITKKVIRKGKLELGFHDGTTRFAASPDYKCGDCVIIDDATGAVSKKIELEKGATVYLFGGSHVGTIGTIEGVGPAKIVVKADGLEFETLKKYAIALGKGKSPITLQ